MRQGVKEGVANPGISRNLITRIASLCLPLPACLPVCCCAVLSSDLPVMSVNAPGSNFI